MLLFAWMLVWERLVSHYFRRNRVVPANIGDLIIFATRHPGDKRTILAIEKKTIFTEDEWRAYTWIQKAFPFLYYSKHSEKRYLARMRHSRLPNYECSDKYCVDRFYLTRPIPR